MDRNTNGARLICECACDRLPDPPGSIRGEFISLSPVKLAHCLEESQVPFLNKIQKRQIGRAPDIFFAIETTRRRFARASRLTASSSFASMRFASSFSSCAEISGYCPISFRYICTESYEESFYSPCVSRDPRRPPKALPLPKYQPRPR